MDCIPSVCGEHAHNSGKKSSRKHKIGEKMAKTTEVASLALSCLLRPTRMYANFAPLLLEPLPSNEAGRSSEGVPSQWPARHMEQSPRHRRYECTIDSHPAFRRALKTHLFRLAFDY